MTENQVKRYEVRYGKDWKPFAREWFGDGNPVAVIELSQDVSHGRPTYHWTLEFINKQYVFEAEGLEAIVAVIRGLPDPQTIGEQSGWEA